MHEYEIQQFTSEGWECVTTEEPMIEARKRVKEYYDNCPGNAFRARKVKVKQNVENM